MAESKRLARLERRIGEAIEGWREIEITEDGKQPVTVQPHALVQIDGKPVLQCRSKTFGNICSITLESITDAHSSGKSFVPDPNFTADGYVVICSVDQAPRG